MKLCLKPLSALFLTALLLTGCDWFDDADNVTFQVVLPVTFEVNEDAVSEGPVPYSKSKVLNALENDEIEKYKNKISQINLDKITYKIENYEGGDAVTFTDGSLEIDGSSAQTLATVASIDLKDTPETELTSVDPASFTAFANQIKNDKEVEVKMAGTVSSTPVAFTITAYFHVTVQAEVLD